MSPLSPDLFMIRLLISFAVTQESASQIKILQAKCVCVCVCTVHNVCVSVCVYVPETEKMHCSSIGLYSMVRADA